MDDTKESRRGWLKMLAAGAGGVVLGSVALECCTGEGSLPHCAVSSLPQTLTVVVHGMAVIGVYQDTVKLVIPKVPCHRIMVGTLPEGLQELVPGEYCLKPIGQGVGPEIPCSFDKDHQILIKKADTQYLRCYGDQGIGDIVQIDLPRPSGYRPFRVIARQLTGSCMGKYGIHPTDFPMGHVLQHSWVDPTAALKGVSDPKYCLPIPVSPSGVLSNFHVYNEDPSGPHMEHHLDMLNTLFSDKLDLDVCDAAAPASVPGCSLQDIGLSAEDECDLSELPKYARKGTKCTKATKSTKARTSRLATDPGSCISYVYDGT